MVQKNCWPILLAALLLIPVTGWGAGDCTVSNSPSGCPFLVKATIQNGCLVSGGAGIPEFGSLNFGSHASVATGTLTTSLVGSTVFQLQCTPGTPLTITIDAGQNGSGGRHVQQGGHTLLYSLYSDAAMQNPMGVNLPISITIGSSGNNVVLPVYGALTLPGPGNATPGIYTDTLNVILSW